MPPGIGDLESQELGPDSEMEEGQQGMEFFSNLAPLLSTEDLHVRSTRLFRLVEGDREARKKRDDTLAEGFKRTGLGGAAPGGADFDGASKVTHPMLTQATVEFASKTGKELLPPNGPVKMFFADVVPQEIRDQAEATADFTNLVLIDDVPEFSEVMEQTLSQVPMGGSAYVKVLWNGYDKKPTFQLVTIDDIYIPYNASSFYSARRITHRLDIPFDEYAEKVNDGTYFDTDIIKNSGIREKSKAKEVQDKIEGKEEPSEDLDRDKEVYEINLLEDFGFEEGFAPYLVTVETDSQKIISIYRNWEPTDDRRKRLHWLVEFGFIPWKNMYLGFPQLIGGLSAAATGALRALLDSAHINNSPSGVKIKGGGMGGQSVSVEIGSITEIEGRPGIDDVRKLMMPLPFNPPSAVLYELLGFLVEAGMGVVRTADESLSDLNNNTPVGTSQAILEQGAVVFSSIHARLHRAMKRLISTLGQTYRIFGNEEEQQIFQKTKGVVPVSDPNIFSETQRFAQAQAIISLSESSSGQGLYDAYQTHKNVLSIMKFPNIDSVLPPPQEPFTGLAVEENVAAVQGQEIKASPEQDHLSHIIVHAGFIESFGQQDSFCGNIIQIVKNIVDHVMFYYANLMMAIVSQASEIPQDQLQQSDLLEQLKPEMEGMMAAAHPDMMAKVQKVIAPILPVLDAAISSFERVSERALPPESRKLLMDSQAQLELVKAQTADMERRAESAKLEASIKANQAVLQATGAERERELKAEVEYAKLTGDAGILIDGNLTPLSENGPSSDTQLQLASQAMATTGLKAETFEGEEYGQEAAE